MREVRLAVAGAVLALAGVAAAVPGLRSPVARLADYRADGPDPHYDVAVDGAALRRAGSILSGRGEVTYLVYAPAASPLLLGNVRAAAALYALPALPVQGVTSAAWILSYGAGAPLPPGARPLHVYRLSREVAVAELRR